MAQRAVDLTGVSVADDELARAAAGGQSAAFDELYRRHADAAWRVAYAVTANRDDAADAVAEAFTRVLTALNAGRLADLDRFRPYLLATTRNASIDVLRRGGRVHPVDDLTHTERPSGAADSSERLVDKLDATLVASAFRSLPERWRSVLWLTEVEGMAPSEAAGLLGVSANGAAQLAVRARAGLRQRYLQAHLRSEVHADCRFTVERLGAYVGGGLAPRDIAKVDQHLAGCEECRARLAELEDLGSTLRRAVLPLPLALGALAWDHWNKVSTGALVAHRARRAVPLPGQRALMGASVGLLGLGIIGATIVGQPPFGSSASNPAGAAPVGQPVMIQQTAATGGADTVPLPIALGPVSAPASAGSGTGSAPSSSASGSSGPVALGPVNTPTAPTAPTTPSSPISTVTGLLPGGSTGGSGSGSGSTLLQVTTSADLAPAPVDATVSAGTSGVGATVNGTSIGSTPTTTSTTSTTSTTAPSLTTSVSSTLTGGTTTITVP